MSTSQIDSKIAIGSNDRFRLRQHLYSGLLGGLVGGGMVGIVHTTYQIVWELLTSSLVWAVVITILGAIVGLYISRRWLVDKNRYYQMRGQIWGAYLGFFLSTILLLPVTPSVALQNQGIEVYSLAIGLLLYGVLSGTTVGCIIGIPIAFALHFLSDSWIYKERLSIGTGAIMGFIFMSPPLLFSAVSVTTILISLIGMFGGYIGSIFGVNEYKRLTDMSLREDRENQSN